MAGRWLTVIGPLLCVACGGSLSTWQTPGHVTPLSYRRADPAVVGSVGKLRRLVLSPIRFERLDETWAVETLTSRTFEILGEQKGYEVLPVDLYADILATALNVPVAVVRRYPDALEKWARESPDGATPPEEVITIVTGLGQALHADGVILIQLLERETRADLYEVATGRIVWRSRYSRESRSRQAVLAVRSLESALNPLEQAVPRVLVEE